MSKLDMSELFESMGREQPKPERKGKSKNEQTSRDSDEDPPL